MQLRLERVSRPAADWQPLWRDARILTPDGIYLACTIRNISCMGAGLQLAMDTQIPTAFRLQIPEDLFEVECVVRHKIGTIIVVEFASARVEAIARYGCRKSPTR